MVADSRELLERRSLADQVFAHIKKMVLSGELRGGERVPEDRIGAVFGVSRTPIREALRRLADYGLVRIVPRSYAEVVALAPADVAKIAEVRAALESLAGRLLAERATDEDVAALRELHGQCRDLLDAGDVAGLFEKDSELHLEIARRSGNPFLLEMMLRLDATVQLGRLQQDRSSDYLLHRIAEHGPAIEAIARRDGDEAARLLGDHAGKQKLEPEADA